MPFVYKQNYEISEIEPELTARGKAGRVGLEIFPDVTKNAGQVRWIQADNYYGLQQMRGLNGKPPHVKAIGKKEYMYEPGVYGEHMLIDETELVTRAGSAPLDTTPIEVDDLIAERDRLLLNRQFDRKEQLAFAAMRGRIEVTIGGENGTQTYVDTYAVQTYTAAIPFSTFATATPILNFQAIVQLGVGTSTSFGSDAVGYLNSVTLNRILNNTNASDYAGKRNMYGATMNSPKDVANFWQAQNMPKLQVYDNGFFPVIGGTTAGQFQKYILDGEIFVVGSRPSGDRVGEMQNTRCAMNPNAAPGPYRFIKDYANGVNAPKEVPPRIEVHRGWSGGPSLLHPSAVIYMLV